MRNEVDSGPHQLFQEDSQNGLHQSAHSPISHLYILFVPHLHSPRFLLIRLLRHHGITILKP